MEMFCLDHINVNILGVILFYKCCHGEKLDKEYEGSFRNTAYNYMYESTVFLKTFKKAHYIQAHTLKYTTIVYKLQNSKVP